MINNTILSSNLNWKEIIFYCLINNLKKQLITSYIEVMK